MLWVVMIVLLFVSRYLSGCVCIVWWLVCLI